MVSSKPSDKVSLSLANKLDLLPGAASILATGLASLFTGIRRGEAGTPTFYLHVAYAVLRKASTRFSILQFQWFSPSTSEVYKQHLKSMGDALQTVDLEHGAKGHWIGDKDALNVLIWYHGGGFCLPANSGYFRFWDSIIKDASAAGKGLAVFAVAYTLAPDAQYPIQLVQSVEALRYILTQHNRTPANVLMAGDSAGGNLAVSVLSHLTSPHQAIASLDISDPLAGVVLMSPWTSLKVSSETEVNCIGDLITPSVAKPWAGAYLGNAKHDYYTDASTAPSSWFKGFKTQRILVLAGQNEIMLGQIQQFVDRMKAGFPSTELFIGDREGHVAPVYNLYVGDDKETHQGKRLKTWLRELL